MSTAATKTRKPTQKTTTNPAAKSAAKSTAAKSRTTPHPLASTLSLRSPNIQTKLTVNTPGDKYEQEADAVAHSVINTPVPLPQPDLNRGTANGLQRMSQTEERESAASVQRMAASDESVQRMAAADESVQRMAASDESIQRKNNSPSKAATKTATPSVSASTAATIRNPGAGTPLPTPIRSRIEPKVGANLSGVRVHSGPSAHRAASSLGARAFTHNNNIFLNRSESSHNLGLMAHESTHVVQQGAAPIQRKPISKPVSEPISKPVSKQPATPASTPDIQRYIPQTILDEIADYARHIPGYSLFTVLIGYDPLRGQDVPATAVNILGGLMGLVPFGTLIFDTLQEHGVIQAAFDWVNDELSRLNLSISRIERTVEAAWEDVRLIEGFDYNLNVLIRHFNRLYQDVVSFAESLVNKIIELIKEAVVSVAEDLLAENKAWSLLKKIIKYDPLRDEAVEATTVEILEDFLILIGKEQELEQMRERGTLEETAAWIDTQIATFQSLLATFQGLITDAWDAIQPENLANLSTNLENLATRAGNFLEQVWTFASTVALKVLELIKTALLTWLSSFATDIPGYHLLTVMLRKDPFTEEAVPRTPINLIRGFMSLIPGGERQFQQMNETGVIPAAAQRIEAAMESLGISWAFVKGLFSDLWNSFTIEDLLEPIEAFTRILDTFGEPLGRLVTFVIEVIKVVMGLILELMHFPSDLVGSIITNALQALDDIKRDPIGFLINLLNAVKRGFDKFFGNILTHLLGGLTGWLFGQLAKAGIQPPAELSLETVLDLVFQILGLTIDNLWKKLADRIGQDKVDKLRSGMEKLEGIWTFITDVQERGISAIWEKIESQISNLWNMVLEKVQSFVMERVITQMTARLLSMLDPTGIMAVINSFVAFFDAVQSAIEYFREILEIINSFTTTVAEIARGSVEGAAQFLENTLAMSLPVAIGFLANQVGLGDLGDRIGEIIADIKTLIDNAINWLLDKAMELGRAFLNKFTQKQDNNSDQKNGKDKNAKVHIEIPFSMSGKNHHLILKEEKGKLVVLMASKELPLTKKFGQFYHTLDNWRFFLEHSVRPNVSPDLQRQIDAKINHLRNIRETQIREYQTIYERTFGSRRNPNGHKDADKEKEAVRNLTERATADAKELREWAIKTGVADLSEEALNRNLRTMGNHFFQEALADRQRRVNNILAQFSTSNGAPVQYRGSLAVGKKGSHKAGVRFNPDSFDIDLYVVDPVAHKDLNTGSDRPIPFSSSGDSDLIKLQNDVVEALEATGAVPGIIVGDNYILLRKTPP